MKKITVVVLLLLSFLGIAQQREKGTVELTPLVGLATSNYYSDQKLTNSSVSSVNLGVNLDYYFNDRWSFRSALLFQKMGSKYNGGFFTFTDELKYVTVPLNANWHFGSTRKWNLNFGPSVGFLTSATSNGVDVKREVNTTQIGLSYGIGYKIEVNENFSILLDFQGMSGLSDVAKDSPVAFKNGYSAFNIGGVFKL